MKPLQVVVFYCVNCVDVNALRLECREQGMTAATFVSLPCSGKVNLLYLLKAVENGADGVFLLTCPKQACRFLEGSSRAENRVRAVDDLLDETGLGKGHIRVLQIQDRDSAGLSVTEMVHHLEGITAGADQTA
ncbi:MAG: hydrogenase iron-sulfur subunit [Pseudomonadota bacterium]